MSVSGCNYRLAQLVCQSHYLTVDFLQIVISGHPVLFDKEPVVYQRLNLQVVIPAGDSFYLILRLSVQHSTVYLSRLACTAYEDTLSVSFQHGPRQPWPPVKIVNVRKGHQLINVFQSFLGCSQKDDMVGSLLFIVNRPVFPDTIPIIEDIAFHSVKYLDWTTLFSLFLSFLGCVRKGLNYAVVCNGYRRLSPCRRFADNVGYFVEAVHGAHLGVGV